MRLSRTKAWGIVLGLALLCVSYVVLLRFPQFLFAYTVRIDGLALHSDRPFPPAAGIRVLRLAAEKLRRSPLYFVRAHHDIYVCNSHWRQVLFFNKDFGVGGAAPYPLTTNVFLRDAHIEDDRLIGPSGNQVAGDRTLDYFFAHEVTHQLTGRAIGLLPYFRLPQWVREGYADYVGNGDSFHYEEARQAFLAGVPEMDWSKAGLYWRFNLLVAYLLDYHHMSVRQLIAEPPSEASVEAAIRLERSKETHSRS